MRNKPSWKILAIRYFTPSRFSVHLKILLFLIPILFLILCPVVYGMAADCQLEPTGENHIGIRYKALLVEDELSETGWALLFGGSGFTMNGGYQPHFIDLIIKGSWAALHDDELCANGFPPVQETWDNFTIEFGLSDYEDWSVQDNDIGAWTRDPNLFPRRYTNIDSRDPNAADKIMAEYQVDEGGTLEGREIEVSFVRAEVTNLSRDENYFMDPDLEGEQLCKPNSQDDILYRHWIATLKVPSLDINSSVDFYINASQGDKINGNNTFNFMWENPGRPVIESDKYKVIIFDPEVKTATGEWEKATRFLVDLRTPEGELPLNDKGELIVGYRKVNYKGRLAIEASFGYGYTDYVIDGDPTDYEPSDATKAVIDLVENIFDTGAPANPYPSIFGTHNGTIKPNQTITVSKLYTYPCEGTGGHTESIQLYEDNTLIANGTWKGYKSDWNNITIHNLTGEVPYVTLLKEHKYNYTIHTGSYPQIHHNTSLLTANGWINCTKFTDANGKIYKDWIPAIQLLS